MKKDQRYKVEYKIKGRVSQVEVDNLEEVKELRAKWRALMVPGYFRNWRI